VILLIDTKRFLDANSGLKYINAPFNGESIVFECNETKFDCVLLRSILQFVNFIGKMPYSVRIPIEFNFKKTIQFSDKLTYVLFECICYQLMRQSHPVTVHIIPKFGITTTGYKFSPLRFLFPGKDYNLEKFMLKFGQELSGNHFRKVVEHSSQATELSILMDDIADFQKYFDINSVDREKITEVLVELVGNAKEHTSSACLIDFDISEKHIKNKDLSRNFRGINISIVNFSKELLGTSLKEKFQTPQDLSERNQQALYAHKCHKRYFNQQYTEEDFYNILAFQHKVSGRSGNFTTGGTGLTKLIKSLEDRSDAYSCYVISGSRRLRLQKEYMLYNDEHWIGFNKTNDFLHAPPDPKLLLPNPFYIPGTAYNLNFVMEVT